MYTIPEEQYYKMIQTSENFKAALEIRQELRKSIKNCLKKLEDTLHTKILTAELRALRLCEDNLNNLIAASSRNSSK